MISKLQLVSNERDKALNELKKAKNNFVIFKKEHVCDSSLNKEIKFLKNRIDCLSMTHNDCAFNTHKLEELYVRKKVLENHNL